MKKICVFCGSNLGNSPEYVRVANDLGALLAKNGIELVYGGANVGLMREVAQSVLENDGQVTGVITRFLAQKHLTLPNISNLITVETMHQRKAAMAEFADGFIALPGGFGTLEELFEMLTAAQLGFHSKPIALINTNGFYNFLKLQLEHMVTEKMVLEQQAKMLLFAESPSHAIKLMEEYSPIVIDKWIEKIRIENGHTVDE